MSARARFYEVIREAYGDVADKMDAKFAQKGVASRVREQFDDSIDYLGYASQQELWSAGIGDDLLAVAGVDTRAGPTAGAIVQPAPTMSIGALPRVVIRTESTPAPPPPAPSSAPLIAIGAGLLALLLAR